jgi:hypothetical protein
MIFVLGSEYKEDNMNANKVSLAKGYSIQFNSSDD